MVLLFPYCFPLIGTITIIGTNQNKGGIILEDLFLLLSLDDFVALLLFFMGSVGSLICIRWLSRQRTFRRRLPTALVVERNINPCQIETYPAAARHTRLRLLLAHARHFDSDETTPAFYSSPVCT
jgi:hypothetical protein